MADLMTQRCILLIGTVAWSGQIAAVAIRMPPCTGRSQWKQIPATRWCQGVTRPRHLQVPQGLEGEVTDRVGRHQSSDSLAKPVVAAWRQTHAITKLTLTSQRLSLWLKLGAADSAGNLVTRQVQAGAQQVPGPRLRRSDGFPVALSVAAHQLPPHPNLVET